MIKEVSAGAVICRIENGVRLFLLLLHEFKTKYWEFPRGKIEGNETLKETAIREVEEETGITDLEITDGFEETIEWYFKRKGDTVFKKATYFLAETKTKEVVLSEELDYTWLPYEEALDKITHKNEKEVLKKAQEFLK